jgi:hypothetical protein
MPSPLGDVKCASVPAEALGALSGLRGESGVTVALLFGRAWVRWDAADERVLRCLLPVPGVELYVERGGHWHRFGRHLPSFEFASDLEYRPLHQVLFPAPVVPVPAPQVRPKPLPIRLVPDPCPRSATALECAVSELARWADTVSAVRLSRLRAAQCRGRLLVLGERLPELASGQRFWGERLLAPLGWRPEPDLPGSALREATGLAADDILLLRANGFEVVPGAALAPLTRAALHLAAGARLDG